MVLKSHPSRVCGLKYQRWKTRLAKTIVTPLAGVWIEMNLQTAIGDTTTVTPLAGVWIEIQP